VRTELARALAFSEDAPPAVILVLANDKSDIAFWNIRRYCSMLTWSSWSRPVRRKRKWRSASPGRELGPLIRHLRESGQLNAGLVLRALLSGHVEMFLSALAELCDLAIARVSAVVYDEDSNAFRALFDKAGFPAASYPAFRAALDAMREGGFDMGGAIRLKRRIVERELTHCAEEENGVDVRPLLTLLRRFAAEAAREEARVFCQELAGDADEDYLLAA
jgi:Uncharacterised protein conserved in bacteria (DUF2336)